MSEPIKIGKLNEANEVARLEMAVAQYLCCPDGCELDGIGCRAADRLGRARRALAGAEVWIEPEDQP